MPARPSYAQSVLSIISSTSYPATPQSDELDALHSLLAAHQRYLRRTVSVEREDTPLSKRKREKDEEKERVALEANRRIGVGLEVAQNRTAAQIAGAKGLGSPVPGIKVKKERTSVSPPPSERSDTSFRPSQTASQPITYAGQTKKKKLKRVVDSDDEGQRERSAMASPPAHAAGTSGLKLKLSSQKHRHPDPSPTPSNSTAAASITVGSSIDFSLPTQPQRPLVPLRPGVQKPPKPGPKRQSEVNEDFSNTKAPSQVAFPTFWSGVEPYLREIREDDLALLNFKAEAPESYEVPPKGRHYTEVWDEEDGMPLGSTPRVQIPSMRHSGASRTGSTASQFIPAADLKEEVLVDEHRGLGSLTERIVAAFMRDHGVGERNYEAEHARREDRMLGDIPEEEDEGDLSRLDVADLEQRMRKELRRVMLLGEHEDFDPANRDDDEITSALRTCQRLLMHQTTLNDARKVRLASIAKHRLAYAEYQSVLESMEKAIEAGWAKRVKKYGIAPRKTNNSKIDSNPRPAVPEALRKMIESRKQWIDSVGRVMKERPKGEVLGLPDMSVFEGIGLEGEEEKDEKDVEDGLEVEEGDMDEVDGMGL